MSWMLLARWGLPVAAFAAWTGAVYFFGESAGRDDCQVETLESRDEAREKDVKTYTEDMGKQREAEDRSERRETAVARKVEELIEEGRHDPEREPAPCHRACVERLQRAFGEIDAAARDAPGAAGAGGS